MSETQAPNRYRLSPQLLEIAQILRTAIKRYVELAAPIPIK